jgi:hypothetical protein
MFLVHSLRRARAFLPRNANLLRLVLACTASVPAVRAQTIFDWTSGVLPTSAILNGQTLNVTNNVAHNYSSTITNNGTVNWQAGSLTSGGAAFLNNGVFVDTAANTLSGTATFTNSGTYRKEGAGTSTISQVVENGGSIVVNAGNLTLSGGGKSLGNVTVNATTARLRISSTNFEFRDGSVLNGPGAIEVTSATTQFVGNITGSANLHVAGGTASINGNTTLTGGGVFSSGTVNGPGTLTLGNTLTLSGATLTGTGNIVANGGAALTNSFTLNAGRALTLGGNSTWSGGSIYGGSGSAFTIKSGAHLATDFDGAFYGAYYGTQTTVIENQGTLAKTGGTGRTDLDAVVRNSGTLDVQAGTLELGRGGNTTGTVTLAPAATLELSNGAFAFEPGAQITGNGTVRVSGGDVTFAQTGSTAANIVLAGGTTAFNGALTSTEGGTFNSGATLTGNGTVSFGNAVTLNGTTLTGPGTLIANGGVAVTNSFSLNGTRSLVFGGNSTWSSGYIYAGGNSAISIPSGAHLSASANTALYGSYYDGTAARTVLTVDGKLTKAPAAAANDELVISARVVNRGAIDVQAGILALEGGGTHTGVATVAHGATLELGGGDHAIESGAQIAGTGTLRVSAGNATFSGANTGSANIVLSGGNATFNGTTTTTGGGALSSGTLAGSGTLTLGGSLAISGGTLTGPGTLNANGGTTLTNAVSFNGTRTLNLAGTSTWNNAAIYGGGGTTLAVLANSTVTATGNTSLYGTYYTGGTTALNNRGTLEHASAGGTLALTATINNTGTLRVASGTMDVRGTLDNTGTLSIADDARLDLSSGNVALNSGSQITGNGTLQLSGASLKVATHVASSGGALLNSGVVEGSGTLTFARLVTLAGGSLLGTGNLIASAGANLTNNIDLKNAQTLTLRGNSTWSGGTIYHGLGSTLLNQGDLTTTHDGSIYHNYGGTPLTFANSGTFTKDTATGVTQLDAVFENSGTVAVKTGTLKLRGGGTNTGNVTLAPNARLEINADTYTFAPSSRILGEGTVAVSGGTAQFNGAATATAQLAISSGNATFTGTTSTSGGGAFTGGTLNGPGNVTFGGPLSIRYITLAGSGNIHAAGGAALTDTFYLKDGQTLTLSGNSTWSGGTVYHGTGSTLVNQGTLLNEHNGHLYHYYGGTRLAFTNAGTFTKQTGTGTTDLEATFNNTGTVNVTSGTLELGGGGTSSGAINVATDATLLVSNGYTISNAAQLNGQGRLRLTGGTLALNGKVGFATVTFDGGRLDGSQTLSGTTYWNSGDWDATTSGLTTTIASGATLHLGSGGYKDFNFRTVEVLAGADVYWTSGYLRSGNGGAFVNRGTFYDRNVSSYSINNPGATSGFGGTFRFSNYGHYVRDTAGTTYVQVPFDNYGTVNLKSGTLELRGGGTMAASSVVSAEAGARLTFVDDYTLADGASFNGADAIFQTGGTLTVNGALRAPIFNWHGGDWNAPTSGVTTTIASGTQLVLANGSYKDFNRRTIEVAPGGTVTWHSGYIRGGNGSAFVNYGLFDDRNASGYSIHNPSDFGGEFRFVNRGTYRREAASATYVYVPFDNYGTMNLLSGSFQLLGGGTMGSTSIVNASAGAQLAFRSDYTIEDGAQFTGNGSFVHSDGTLSIQGALKAKSFHWSGGDWNADSGGTAELAESGVTALTASTPLTSIAAGTLLVIDNGGYKNFSGRSITIDSGGTVRWESGYLQGGQGSVFTNDGTFADRNASGYSIVSAQTSGHGGSFTFVNRGTYVRDVGSTTYFTAPFENYGTLTLAAGNIELKGGGTMAATSLVDTAAGTHLYLRGDYTIVEGARFTGTGAVIHDSGTLTLNGALRAPTFTWSGGDWNAEVPGHTTTIASGTTLVVAGYNKDFNRRTLDIAPGGTLVWQSGYLRSGNDGAIVNRGTFADQNASSYDIDSPTASGLGGNFTFTNSGTYNKTTSGTTRVEIPFTNSGTMNLHAGTMNFTSTFTNSGSISFAGNAALSTSSSLSFGSGQMLSGTGTLQAPFVSAAGAVSPGNSAGRLTINGAFSLLGASTLLIELASAGQGVGYDHLNVTGVATLGGQLELKLLSGFGPTIAATDTFTVLSSATLTGAFANVANGQRLFTSDGYGSFLVSYGTGSAFPSLANSVVLSQFQAIPEPSTYALLALGAVAVWFTTRRKRR